MAIWQYTFHVLPKESVETLSSEYHFIKGEDGFDDEPFWKLNPVNRGFFQPMLKILPKNKSWSNEIDLYGNQESNCLEVIFQEGGNIISVSFRIDFRGNYEMILSNIVEFCLRNGLVILDESLSIVPLNCEQVKSIINFSPQMKKYIVLTKKDR
jgi:hypothetical protein